MSSFNILCFGRFKFDSGTKSLLTRPPFIVYEFDWMQLLFWGLWKCLQIRLLVQLVQKVVYAQIGDDHK